MADLSHINAFTEAQAKALFLKCCGSRRWAERMAKRRPFADTATLEAAALEIWNGLEYPDWLEAFAAHPRIGEKLPASQEASEQSGMNSASVDVRIEIESKNKQYEEKFGHVFLICASGKSASELLVALRERLANEADVELGNAVQEQAKITQLRLRKLLAS